MKRAITWVATVAAMAVLIDASSAQNAPLVEFNGRKVPESVLAVISVDLEDMPFEEVLADIAAKGNFELNYNRSRIPVKEKLTVRMENMRALDILIHVMKKTGTELVVTREGRLAVVPAEEQSDQRSRKKSTLSGFVRDHSDGESLPNATVAVAFESQKRMGALSNAEGYYAITSIPSGICMVTVSYIGYATYRDTLWLAAGQDLRRDIELEREALQMEGVVVEAKADRVEHEMRKQPSMVSLQIKSLKQMPAMGETDLLRGLQEKYKLAYLFISHDLKVVRAISNHVIVMQNGKVVEQGPATEIFDSPREDYTKALMAAAFDLAAVRSRVRDREVHATLLNSLRRTRCAPT